MSGSCTCHVRDISFFFAILSIAAQFSHDKDCNFTLIASIDTNWEEGEEFKDHQSKMLVQLFKQSFYLLKLQLPLPLLTQFVNHSFHQSMSVMTHEHFSGIAMVTVLIST